MNERIEAWIRLRDAARFRRDTKVAAEGVEDIGDEAAIAAAKLRLMNQEGKRQSGILRGLGGVLNSFTGRLQLLAIAGGLAGPALISIASSAGAATVGLGLMGAAAGTAAAVGFGGLIAVGNQAFGLMKKVKTAQYDYNLAVAQFGKESDQAAKKLDKLNAVYKVGGNELRRSHKLLKQFTSGFEELTQPAQRDFLGTFASGLEAANRLLPTFARQTNLTADSIRGSLRPAMLDLSSPEMAQNIRVFSRAFRDLANSAIGGGTNLIIALLRYARAAAPFTRSIGRDFAMWARDFRQTSEDGGLVRDRVKEILRHTRAWLGLAKALGGLLMAVFRSSNVEGRSLVVTLTDGINRLTDWINRANETGAGQATFKRWGDLAVGITGNIVQLVAIIGRLANAALPGLNSASDGLSVVFGIILLRLNLLTAALEFLGPLVGPLIIAFAAWKAATIALTIATTALNIAFRLTPLGWIVTGIGLVIAAVVLMWNKWAGFRNFIMGVWSAIRAAWDVLSDRVTGALDRWRDRVQWVIDKFNALKDAVVGIKDTIANALPDIPGIDIGGALNAVPGVGALIPGNAMGGTIPPGETHVVGEGRGPELARHTPSGTVVTPINRVGITNKLPRSTTPVIHAHLTTIVKAKGRELGRAHAEEVLNAREGIG